MRIQHNIPAMNSLTNYTRNNNALAGNLEKLSSGFRINSAADDAAGLAISEKMRSQIKGLEKAYDNANDGISLVQTAEGALTEVNSMLTRLTELATQSANGTYQDDVDREAIQEETEAILDEIDRISKATNYNGINLLDGSLGSKSQVDGVSIDTTTAIAGKFTTTALTASATFTSANLLTTDNIGKSFSYNVTWKDAQGNEKTTSVSLTFQGRGDGTVDATTAANNHFTDDMGNSYAISGTTLDLADLTKAIEKGLSADKEFNDNFSVSTSGGTFIITARESGSAGATIVDTGVGSNINNMNAATLNIAGAGNATVTEAAKNAMQKIDLSSIKAITSADDEKAMSKKIFEIDGHKFAVVDTSLTADQRKALGDDVTLIESGAAGEDLTAGAALNGKIASEIQRVTGLKTNVAAAANANAGIDQFDILFTEDNLRLGSGKGNGGLTLQVGDTNDSFQKVTVAIEDMSSKGIGIAGLDLSDQDKAGDAIKTIKNAVNTVSAQRGRLGALQNRLDHTLNNLDATTENITSSESQIRDVNMAKEMTAYTKNNILAQAAQSMLAQANSMPQGVLQLLQ